MQRFNRNFIGLILSQIISDAINASGWVVCCLPFRLISLLSASLHQKQKYFYFKIFKSWPSLLILCFNRFRLLSVILFSLWDFQGFSNWFSGLDRLGNFYVNFHVFLLLFFNFKPKSYLSLSASSVFILISDLIWFIFNFNFNFDFNFNPYFRRELSDHAGSRLPGYIVLISQVAHLLVMGDFFYYYFKSLSKGLPMQLPVTNYSTSV